MWKVTTLPSVIKSIERLPFNDQERIIECVNDLKFLPSLSSGTDIKKLAGYKNTYRVRVGVYRLIFEIHKDIITIKVIKLSHRKDAYKK